MKSAAVFLALVLSGIAHAKDGHGSHAGPAGKTGAWAGYKGTPRTFYRYTPPSSVPKTPQSAYAPVTSSTSSTATGTLKGTYRQVTSDQRMSKDYSAKVNQGLSTGKSSLKTWSEKAKSRLK